MPTAPRKTTEMQCPACGHTIKSTAGGGRRRVQCPKCREVVELTAPPTQAAPDLVALLDRCELLDARIRTLEKILLQLASERSAQPTSLEPSRKLRWVASPAECEWPEGFPPELEAALLHNLNAMPSRAITIQAAAGDTAARWRAERLKEIFQRARWAVHGPREVSPPGEEHGLSLAVGSLPPSSDVAATYLALTASGFSPHSLLDPNLGGDDAVLIVA